ncbi:MAG: hypothetical protein DRJ14_01065 [Acidobacteria bacterium]|nr:MAG: hypothetical protein DRJ14_01065 [Acidobacteriota bacterium]
MKRFNLKDMIIGFLLGVVVVLGLAATSAAPRETFSSMLSMGSNHYYIVTTQGIYHVKLRQDHILDTSRVATIKDIKRDVVIRYNR